MRGVSSIQKLASDRKTGKPMITRSHELGLMSVLQRNSRSKWQQANEKVAQSKNFKGWFILVPALFFVIMPLMTSLLFLDTWTE